MSNYLSGGLEKKYIIAKTSGNPVDPKADYFVLRLDADPNAIKAILAYAVSVMEQNPQLAFDLFKKAEHYLNKLPDEEHVLMLNASLAKQLNTYIKAVVNLQEKLKTK